MADVNMASPRSLCTVNRRTLKYKVLYFSNLFGRACFLKFLSVFYRAIGMSSLQTGVLMAIRVLARLIGGPVWGWVADKTGRYKLVLVIVMLGMAVSFASLSGVLVAHSMDEDDARAGNTTQNTNTTLNWTKKRTARTGSSYLTDNPYNSVKSAIRQFSPLKDSVKYTKRFRDKSGLQKDVKIAAIHGIRAIQRHAIGHVAGGHAAGHVAYRHATGHATAHATSETLPDKELYRILTISNHTNNNNTLPFTQRLTNSEVFTICLVTVVTGEFFLGSIFPLLDGACIHKEGIAVYGKQRMFAPLGYGTGAFISGLAMDKTAGVHYFYTSTLPKGLYPDPPNFMTAILLFCFVNIVVVCMTWCFDFTMERKPGFDCQVIRGVLRKLPVICGLITLLIIGMVSSVIFSFILWFAQDLGGSQVLLGLTETVMCFSAAVFYQPVNKLLLKIGNAGIMSLTLLGFIAVLLSFSYINNPWIILVVMVLYGFTFATMQISCVAFASAHAPSGAVATMQGLVQGVQQGLGVALGGVLGGVFYQPYGPRLLFRGTAILSAAGFIPLAIMYKTRDRGVLYARMEEPSMTIVQPSSNTCSNADEDTMTIIS